MQWVAVKWKPFSLKPSMSFARLDCLMERELSALQVTLSSPGVDGSPQKNSWKVRSLSARKTCPVCSKQFGPKRFTHKGKKDTYPCSELHWNRQVTCSPSCAKRWKNPMHSAESRGKMRSRLLEIGHRPKVRWGNGNGLTVPQQKLLNLLGEGWIAEHPIATGMGHKNGIYPNSYKVDLACPTMMIALEVDGGSHGTLARQAEDKKKDALLAQLGWKVFRVSNAKALKLCSTCTSAATLLTLLGAS